MSIKILRNEKLEIDYVDNPNGLPYIDIIVRNENGKITGWHSINKEQVDELIGKLQMEYDKL